MHQLHEAYHEFRNMSQFAIWLLHVEALAEAQISQDVEHQIRHLISHIDAVRPCLAQFFSLPEQAEPPIDVRVDKYFGATKSTLRKCVVDHATLSRMDRN